MGSRVKEEDRNERAIRALLKIPGNRRCINCNSTGPQYVCTSFSTFICINCSGIHREFTHRVKSISMAKFTSQEVSALQEGGNEQAKEIYFKNWDFQGQSVPDSSDVDRLRNFIKNVYVDRRYTGERTGDHPPEVKGNRDISYGSNNVDSSRGAPEDKHGPQCSTENTSEDRIIFNRRPIAERIDQKNGSTAGRENSSFKNHQHLDKTGGKSENYQKDTTSVTSVVEPSKGTNGVILPVKLIEPPKSHKTTTSTTFNGGEKAAPPGAGNANSETGRDVKLDMSKSLIDFDSDPEPHQVADQMKVQKNPPLPSADVGWATFDVATPKSAMTIPSVSSTNSLEAPPPLLQLPNSVPARQTSFPTVQTTKPLSFPQANHGGQQHQLYMSPVDNIQSNSRPLNRASSAPVNSQMWARASHAPIQGSSALPSNEGTNIFIGTRDPVMVASKQPVSEVSSSLRKALPEDIFTMSYRPAYASTWDWQANPQINMGYGQYGMHYPVGSLNTTQPFANPNSVNSFNMSRGPTLAHASTFPSLASMPGAPPDMGSMTLFSRAPSMGSVMSLPQVPPTLAANNQYIVQQRAVNMAHQVQNNNVPTGYQGVRGVAATGSAYGLSSSSLDQRMAAQNLQAMAQSSFPRVGGNPFA